MHQKASNKPASSGLTTTHPLCRVLLPCAELRGGRLARLAEVIALTDFKTHFTIFMVGNIVPGARPAALSGEDSVATKAVGSLEAKYRTRRNSPPSLPTISCLQRAPSSTCAAALRTGETIGCSPASTPLVPLCLVPVSPSSACNTVQPVMHSV